MKGFIRSRVALTLAVFIMSAAAIAIPLSRNVARAHAQTLATGVLLLNKVLNDGGSGFTGGFTMAYDCTLSGSPEITGLVSVVASGSANGSGPAGDIPAGYVCTVSEPSLGMPTPPTGFCWGNPVITGSPATIIAGTFVPVTVTNTLKKACLGPTLAEYLQLSNAAYQLDQGSLVVPPGYGMTILESAQQPGDGFLAYAVKDSNGYIIIANEGTVGDVIDTFATNSELADFAISRDQTPQALLDAQAFAMQVEQDNPGHIYYVTGHSLGGIEAEAEAQALGANFAGGATFGATGLPGNATPGGPATLINYVDYGDPVGNYASDPNSPLQSHTAGVMFHYGSVTMIGSPSSANWLYNAVAAREQTLLLPGQYLAEGVGIVALVLGVGAYEHHPIADYAADLQIPLTTPVAPALSPDAFMLAYGAQLGDVGLQNAEATTDPNATTLVSPDMTVKFDPNKYQIKVSETTTIQESWGTDQAGGNTTIVVDPQTGLITNETYKSPDGSVLTATLDSNETVTVLQLNQSAGGSSQISYDTTNSQPWRSYTTFYPGANEKGGVVESIYNLRAGGSEVHLFTGLPAGYTEEIQEWSGLNGTGTLLSTQFIQ